MGMSDLGRVNSFQSIEACPAQKPQDACLIKSVQGQGTSVQPVCYQSSQSADPGSWYPSLSQFNGFVPNLFAQGYREVCRSPAAVSAGRYALYLSKGVQTPAVVPQAVQPVPTQQTPQTIPQNVSPAQPAQQEMDFLNDKMLAISLGIAGSVALGVASYVIYRQNRMINALQRQMQMMMAADSTPAVETGALERFGINLNERFEEGYVEPLNMGLRVEEVKRMRVALMKQRKFVVLSGEEGVGKGALVEMLATGIQMGIYPELKGTQIISINLDAVEAGATSNDSFEMRLQTILTEAAALNRSGQKVVLFIDGIHRIMGTSSTETSLEGFKILKAALVNGDITIYGSTTQAELDKISTVDSDLAGRIYNISVEPLSASETVEALTSKLQRIGSENEKFPQMRISSDALDEVMYLAEEYIAESAFPEKAEDLLREAVAFKRMNCVSDPFRAQELTAADVHKAFEYRYQMSVPSKAEVSNIWAMDDMPIILPEKGSPLDTANPYATVGFDISEILELYVSGQLSKEKWYRDLLPNRQSEVLRAILVSTHQAEFRVKYMVDGKVSAEGIMEALKMVDILGVRPAGPVRVEAPEKSEEKSGPKKAGGRKGESGSGKIPFK